MARRYQFIDNPISEFNTHSETIDRYYRRDFSPIKQVMRNLFPNSAPEIINNGQLRVVPTIWAICRELATLYSVPPARKFQGLTSDELQQRMQKIYTGIGIDSKMRTLHELLICQQSAILLVMPDSNGTISLHCLPPYRVEVESDDILNTDARSIKEWKLKLPRKRTQMGTFTEDTLVINSEQAYWEGEGVGAWNAEGTNPLGVAPVIVARAQDVSPGMFFCNLPMDLLNLQESTIIAATDILRVASHHAWGQKVLTGMSPGEASHITLGPDVALGLESDQNYAVVSGSPQTADYQHAQMFFQNAVLGANRVNSEHLFKSSSVTAAAKILEGSDREIERRILGSVLQATEQRLYKMIARWVNVNAGINAFPINGVSVDVDFRSVQPVADPLHEAQALVLRMKLGLSSPAETVAKERGISVADAETVVAENLAAYRNVIESVGEINAKIDKSAGGAAA